MTDKKILTDENTLVGIADAIRAKTGKTASLKIDSFKTEIAGIEAGSSTPTLVLHSLELS